TKKQSMNHPHPLAGSNAQPAPGRVGEAPIAAEAVISLPGNMLSRAFAGVHVMRAAQAVEGVPINVAAIALPQERMQTLSGLEPKPGEVLENARFVFGPAADAIVVPHP